MQFLEYERLNTQFQAIKRDYAELLDIKAELFVRTQPGSIDPGKQPGGGGTQDSPFDQYIIAKEQKQLDQRIAQAWDTICRLERLVDLQRAELRRSRDLWDRIYVAKHLDHLSVTIISVRCWISRSAVYRSLKKISALIGKVRQSDTPPVV